MVRFRLIGKTPKIRFDAKRGKIAKRRRGSRLCTLKNRLVIHDGIARALRMNYARIIRALPMMANYWYRTGSFATTLFHHEVQVRVIPDEFSRNMACYHILAEYGVLPRSTSLCHPEWILAGSPHRSLDPWRPTNKPIQTVCHVCAPPAQCGAIRILVQLDMP